MTALTGIEWYQVDVRGRTRFKCDGCGAVAQGESVRYAPGVLVSYDGPSLGQHLSKMRGSSGHMPVGWSSRYLGIHMCPVCNKEK